MVPLKSVAVQWLEYLSFDIDTVMNKQYLEKASALGIKGIKTSFVHLKLGHLLVKPLLMRILVGKAPD